MFCTHSLVCAAQKVLGNAQLPLMSYSSFFSMCCANTFVYDVRTFFDVRT